MPELPAARRARLLVEYGLREYDAEVLTSTRAMGDYFERAAKIAGDPRAAANWVMGDLAGLLKAEGKDISESPVSAEHLGQLVALVVQSKIGSKLAKEILPKMFASGDGPEAIMKREGLESISDENALAKIVEDAIAANPKQHEQYRGGKTTVLAFFVGQVMKATRGQADPAAVNKLLREKL